MEPYQPAALPAQQWVDHQNYHYKYLTINNNTIAFNYQQQSKYIGAYVFGSWVLSSSKCTFALQLNKIDYYIAVGVIDEQYKQREKLDYEECPNWICYYSDGDIINKQKQTKGHAVYK